MPGRIEFEYTTRNKKHHGPRAESVPMHILVLGDFSAHDLITTPNEQSSILQRKLYSVDVDNLEQVLTRIAPQLSLNFGENLKANISFTSIDDFHPDTLYRRVSMFNQLRDLQTHLHKRDTYPEAAVQLRTMLSLKSTAEPPGEVTIPLADSENVENDAATLERLLGKPAAGVTRAGETTRSAVDRLFKDALKGLVQPDTDAGQQVYFDVTNLALSELMRKILHHPDFQNLEALWRSIEFLINRLELSEDIQLSLLDVTKDELMDDFRQADFKLERSELYRLLVEQGVHDRPEYAPGTNPWSLLIGQYSFNNSMDDMKLLAALGNIGEHIGGPFLAQASSTLLGCDSLAKTPYPYDWSEDEIDARQRWEALRASPAAEWIGLTLPRLLLRLPYAQDTDEIESFKFQEIEDPTEHQQFLWGNPAIGCALLIAQAFTERGWKMAPGDLLDIGELPAYSYLSDDGTRIIPCAEVYLTETAAEKILDMGLMPMISIKNSNRVRLLRFQSIASPAALLAGAWT